MNFFIKALISGLAQKWIKHTHINIWLIKSISCPQWMHEKKLEELKFENSYSQLPDIFYSRHTTSPLSNQHLISFNTAAAELIGIDPEESKRKDFPDIISGAKHLEGFDPLAMCYSGHQFGHYVPRLGDGRAILLAEVKTDSGDKWDLQVKGGGQTLYSRGSDGRAVLRSTIREYLCSEAMHGLGIATTRALCIIGSDHEVYREQIETGALLLRMSPSHVRFGSFEYMYYNQRFDDLKQLADYVIEQHHADFKELDEPYLALLKLVIKSTAELIAQWQSVGFAHGVMNTDNMSILGLTLDYGPYGFLDQYNRDFICNHSDHEGRYAFNKQPDIGLFNVSCLAQALLPLLDDDPDRAVEKAKNELQKYQQYYVDSYSSLMRNKLGLYEDKIEDKALVSQLLNIMHDNHVDYTMLFRQLSQAPSDEYENNIRDLFINREACDLWLHKYKQRITEENTEAIERSKLMKQVNPKYILRNYMVEIAIRKASDNQDYSEIDVLLNLLQNPFEEHDDLAHYAGQPPEWAQQISVSCSS